MAVPVGLILYGAATLQARVLPRWCGLGLIIVPPVAVVFGDYGGIVFGLLWVALGYVLGSQGGDNRATLAGALGKPARLLRQNYILGCPGPPPLGHWDLDWLPESIFRVIPTGPRLVTGVPNLFVDKRSLI